MAEAEEQFVAAPRAPGAPLRAVGYRSVLERPRQHRGLPSPHLTFIVTFDQPVRVAGTVEGGPATPADLDVLLAGLHLKPARVRMAAVQTGVQVAIDPLAARALFGVPARELRGRSLLGDEVIGTAAARLRERLATAPDWPERFRILGAETGAWVAAGSSAPRPRPELVAAWRLLEASRGRIRIERLAAEVHLSRRRLSDLFAEELGVSPKQAARTMRFTHAVARIGRGVRAADLDLAAVAAECGYADQSHLVREFQALAGASPSGWIAEEFPNIQAGGHRYAAEWEA
ncbi:MAG: helix-turn-helix transcriptional regulator [Actinobacteria bacterium]|nr:helix-turn-helix transcriptional regulator [Actinomycetota bacterium]